MVTWMNENFTTETGKKGNSMKIVAILNESFKIFNFLK
jgi:hypothetical protein